jgi:hypothetical protein
MKVALLLIWVWMLYHIDESLWAKLIKDKYTDDENISSGTCQRGLAFLKNSPQNQAHFQSRGRHEVRDGHPTHFWLDWWKGGELMNDRFPFFVICDDSMIFVAHSVPN